MKHCLLLASAGDIYAPYGWFRVGNQGIQENFTRCKKKFCELRGGTCPLSTPPGSALDVKQIRSSDNLTDLFTKTLPTATFKKLVNNIGMHRLKYLSS